MQCSEHRHQREPSFPTTIIVIGFADPARGIKRMRRREFIAGIGSAAVWPLPAQAQQGERIRRIGVLFGGYENDPVGTYSGNGDAS
jgi:hypothetical protein